MDQAALAHQKFFGTSENAVKKNHISLFERAAMFQLLTFYDLAELIHGLFRTVVINNNDMDWLPLRQPILYSRNPVFIFAILFQENPARE